MPPWVSLQRAGARENWDIKPMSSKAGYKLILTPGSAMKGVFSLTQRRQLAFATTPPDAPLSKPCELAKSALIEQGVSPAKATELVRKHEPHGLIDRIEYVACQVETNKAKIKNPAGFLMNFIEAEQQIPASFRTKRQRNVEDERRAELDRQRSAENARYLVEMKAREEYRTWCDSQAEQFISTQLIGDLLSKRLRELSSQLRKNQRYATMLDGMFSDLRRQELMRALKQEIVKELNLPSFEEWTEQTPKPSYSQMAIKGRLGSLRTSIFLGAADESIRTAVPSSKTPALLLLQGGSAIQLRSIELIPPGSASKTVHTKGIIGPSGIIVLFRRNLVRTLVLKCKDQASSNASVRPIPEQGDYASNRLVRYYDGMTENLLPTRVLLGAIMDCSVSIPSVSDSSESDKRRTAGRYDYDLKSAQEEVDSTPGNSSA